jgi:hypothetical protein
MHIATEVIHQLDIAQDHRLLSAEESQLWKELKNRVLGLEALERSHHRQASRLIWFKEGDACTRFFHLKASSWSRKKFIHCLRKEDGSYAWPHDQKEHLLFDHFQQSPGSKERQQASLNSSMLDLPQLSANHLLDAPFFKSEIRNAIMDLPNEKAPGPDGFTGLFYRSCWDIIKAEVTAVFQCIDNLTAGPLPKLIGAVLTLLPKTDAADRPGDYRLIGLIHFFAKLISMVLAQQLAPHMSLVSHAQSAFIKRRCIQDNFLYVRNLARAYHRKKVPAILLQIDISNAFDPMSWEYLLELLEHRGFPTRWRNWLALMLSSSSSSVRLNLVQ